MNPIFQADHTVTYQEFLQMRSQTLTHGEKAHNIFWLLLNLAVCLVSIGLAFFAFINGKSSGLLYCALFFVFAYRLIFYRKKVLQKSFAQIVRNQPSAKWTVRYKFYDTAIEVIEGNAVNTLDYQQFNGIINLVDRFILHRYGQDALCVHKADFVNGDPKDFPLFISERIDQSVPSQLAPSDKEN